MTKPLEVATGAWVVHVVVDGLPDLYRSYRQNAALCDEFDLTASDGSLCFVGVGAVDDHWPRVLVAQRFSPGIRSGFGPGTLLAHDTSILFVGAGTRLLAYDLKGARRLWEDATDVGFWSWRQHGSTVVMAAEVELAAWSTSGEKLWSTFVEPPWSYRVHGEIVELEVMGQRSEFELCPGPGNA